MNRKALFILILILFSCSKEKQCNRYLAGDWDIKNYSEIIFDGTINKYTLISGSAHFDNLKGKTEANFQLDLNAVSSFDTVERVLSGTYSRRSIDTLELAVNGNQYLFDINRIFKKDLNLQGGFDANRKGIFIMKKK